MIRWIGEVTMAATPITLALILLSACDSGKHHTGDPLYQRHQLVTTSLFWDRVCKVTSNSLTGSVLWTWTPSGARTIIEV